MISLISIAICLSIGCFCLFLLFAFLNCFRSHKVSDYPKEKQLRKIADGWRSGLSDTLDLFRSYYPHRISKFERDYSYGRLWVTPQFFDSLVSLDIVEPRRHETIGIIHESKVGPFLSHLVNYHRDANDFSSFFPCLLYPLTIRVDVWRILLGVDPDALRMRELLRTNRLTSELFGDESSDPDALQELEDSYPPKAFSASPPVRVPKSPPTKGKNPFGEPPDGPVDYFLPQRPNPFLPEHISPQEDGSSVRSFPISATKYDSVRSPFYPPEDESYWEDTKDETQIDIPTGKARPQSAYSTDGERLKRRRSTLMSAPTLAIPSLAEVAMKLGQTTCPLDSEESNEFREGRLSVHIPVEDSDSSSHSLFSSPCLHKPSERHEMDDIPKKENSFIVSRQHQRALIVEDKFRCRFGEISRNPEKADKLELLLEDWLQESDENEYVQGMLALSGLLVLGVEDRNMRRLFLNILDVIQIQFLNNIFYH